MSAVGETDITHYQRMSSRNFFKVPGICWQKQRFQEQPRAHGRRSAQFSEVMSALRLCREGFCLAPQARDDKKQFFTHVAFMEWKEYIPRIFHGSNRCVRAPFCLGLPEWINRNANKYEIFGPLEKVRPALGKAGRARTRSGDERGGDVTGNA
jgi:hypothetical protein